MKLGKIVSLKELAEALEGRNLTSYVVSGAFDPLHIGSLRCVQAAHYLAMDSIRHKDGGSGVVIAIVHGDGMLYRGKGYAFMPLQERMEVICGLSCVNYVVPWGNGSDDIIAALKELKPHYYCSGGGVPMDASLISACNAIDCQVLLNVGGSLKVQSSSTLVKQADLRKEITETVLEVNEFLASQEQVNKD